MNLNLFGFLRKIQPKKEFKIRKKVSIWVSNDLEIDRARKREEAAKENELPHPIV